MSNLDKIDKLRNIKFRSNRLYVNSLVLKNNGLTIDEILGEYSSLMVEAHSLSNEISNLVLNNTRLKAENEFMIRFISEHITP